VTDFGYLAQIYSVNTARINMSSPEFESETAPIAEVADGMSNVSIATTDERNKQDSKFVYKAPEENRHKYEPKVWQKKAFTGVSPLDFAMQQKNREKERKEKEAAAKVGMYVCGKLHCV
jgi:hypothetical protein